MKFVAFMDRAQRCGVRKRHTLPRAARRAGFTLMELVLAAGLLAILMVAVFALIDGSMQMWRRSETRRNLTEQATGVVELLNHDLRALEGGERGDLLIEWVRFDTDGDEIKETLWPRLRLVRQASPAEIARLFPVLPEAEDAQSLNGEQGAKKKPPAKAPDAAADLAQPGALADVEALIEVCWAVVPMERKERDGRPEGLIYRGARKLTGGKGNSYFEPSFIKASGLPYVEELDEVTGGLLWFQPLMATQTSIVHEEWTIGSELQDAATSWDAWELDRPDTTIHGWNQPNRGMPKPKNAAILPRRFRVELEFERPVDRKRRARTTQRIELADVAFDVDDGMRMPEEGHHVKVDGEWMLLMRVSGDRVTVKRAQRGTLAMIHDSGGMVHWGLNMATEIPVALYREDWDL